jgi:hypothetical protein
MGTLLILYMSKQTEEPTETKVWNNVDYTNTWAFKTIEVWKEAATEAGLVLEFPYDFPNDPAGQLERLRTIDNIAVTKKGPIEKVVTSMFRQMVHSRDKDGKPTSTECIYYSGEIYVTDYRGLKHSCEWKDGIFQRPGVVPNSSLRYNPETGAPVGQEKVLSGQKNNFFIELPKEKAARKKFIDNIISSTNSIKENIAYYYQELGQHNFAVKSEGTFSYEDFVNCSIEELQQLSARGGGSKSSGYYRDRDGVLRDRDDNKLE